MKKIKCDKIGKSCVHLFRIAYQNLKKKKPKANNKKTKLSVLIVSCFAFKKRKTCYKLI